MSFSHIITMRLSSQKPFISHHHHHRPCRPCPSHMMKRNLLLLWNDGEQNASKHRQPAFNSPHHTPALFYACMYAISTLTQCYHYHHYYYYHHITSGSLNPTSDHRKKGMSRCASLRCVVVVVATTPQQRQTTTEHSDERGGISSPIKYNNSNNKNFTSHKKINPFLFSEYHPKLEERPSLSTDGCYNKDGMMH